METRPHEQNPDSPICVTGRWVSDSGQGRLAVCEGRDPTGSPHPPA